MKLKRLVHALAITALTATSTTASAAAILFAQVQGGSYINDGNELAGYLSGAGHTVTQRYLHTDTYSDFDSFDQIFVYDLSTGLNNNIHQTANYFGISNWYNSLANQNLILDGRIISSAWANENAWIQNYATQLDSRGGGLVLGTDHASLGQDSGVYVDGINLINDQIGVERFHDAYYPPYGWNGSPGDPMDAIVDENSPLYIGSLLPCSFDTSSGCINDNSSTSFVATGIQTNGQTLTPVAYHGNALDAWDRAAVSATMGSVTFGTCGNPGQPPCVQPVPEPSILALMGLGFAGLGFARRRKLRA